jgi:hypothetical protein
MQTLRNKLIALAAVVILAAVGLLMNSHQAAAQGPLNGLAVNVTNPVASPVPTSAQPGGPLTNLGRLASEMVVLKMSTSPGCKWFRVFADLTFNCFSIPVGSVLVITDFDWSGTGTAGDVDTLALGYALLGGPTPVGFNTAFLNAAGRVGTNGIVAGSAHLTAGFVTTVSPDLTKSGLFQLSDATVRGYLVSNR